MDNEEDYIEELTWRGRLIAEVQHFLSLSNFRKLLMNSLIVSSAFYFTSIDYTTLDWSKPLDLIMSKMILKFLVAFFLILWVFYKVPMFFMRLYFHVYVRNKFLKLKEKFEAEGRFRLLRETHGIYKGLSLLMRNYIFNLGYFSRNDLRLEMPISEDIKQEMLNDLLVDCYKWMCCLMHLLFTLFFIWNYVNFWLIVIALFGIGLNFAMAYMTFPLVMNLEILNKIRFDIIKDRKLGMRVMELD